MSASSATSAAGPAPCRACGAATTTGARRCGRCFADLFALDANPAAVGPVSAERFHTPAFLQAVRGRLTPRRVILLLLLAVVAWRVIPGLIPPQAIPAAEGVRSAVQEEAWGYIHGGAGNTRATNVTVKLSSEALWSVPTGTLAAPAVVDDVAVYVVLADRRLLAISREDGAMLWTREYDYTLTSSPTASDGRLFILQRGGGLQAVDAATGDVIWETEPLGAYGVAPIVVDGSVYLFFGLDNDGQETGLVSQVDADTGRVLWRGSASRAFPGHGMAVGDGSMAVIGSRTLELYDREFGERTFWFTFRYGADAVAISDGTAYVVTAEETAAISLAAERPWWDGVRGLWNRMNIQGMAPTPPPVPSVWLVRNEPREAFAPVISTTAVIVADRAGSVRAHDRASGEEQWGIEGAPITAAPVLTAAGLLVTRGAEVDLVAPDSGEVLDQREVGAHDDPITQAIPTDRGLILVSAAGVLTQLAP